MVLEDISREWDRVSGTVGLAGEPATPAVADARTRIAWWPFRPPVVG